MKYCVAMKSNGKPCGQFVLVKGDLCANCKKKSVRRKYEDTYQEKLRADPTLMKEMQERRLYNQRVRNGTKEENFKKRLDFPSIPEKKKTTSVKKRSKARPKHGRVLRPRKNREEEPNLTDSSDDEDGEADSGSLDTLLS